MFLSIETRSKLEKFIYLFQLLKVWDSHITLYFKQDGLFIQSMDKSHVCLANIVIASSWFDIYGIDEDTNNISVSSLHFSMILNYALKPNNKLEINYDINSEPDKLIINILNNDNNKNYDHLFELPLIDIEQEILDIPDIDYEVEITINSSKINEVINDLHIFGNDLNIECDEDNLNLYSAGDNGKLNIPINIENLEEYAISDNVNMLYSLNHIKMCLSTKLKDMIDIYISIENPMQIKYELGDFSNVLFFIAPKIQ
jgi:proliferating cell nuclear antigen PCNA